MARRIPAPALLGRTRFFASMSSTEPNRTLSSLRGALFGLAILAIVIATRMARGGDVEALAKQAQNPISDLISVPIEENLSFGNLDGETQHVVNVSPVYPLELNDDWLLINRAIIPAAIYLPSSVTGSGDEFGFGDINFTTFLSPRKSTGRYFWGAGPSLTVPSATDDVLGTGKWSVGPSFVFLMEQGPWVTGFLVTNAWSIAGKSSRADVNAGFLQPWLYYNFPSGAYIFSEPVITVDWKADKGDRWTVPVGIGVGKVFQIGNQFLNFQVAAFYNVEKPSGSADWTIRPQIQFLFPK
jgi:hypothetical protein